MTWQWMWVITGFTTAFVIIVSTMIEAAKEKMKMEMQESKTYRINYELEEDNQRLQKEVYDLEKQRVELKHRIMLITNSKEE